MVCGTCGLPNETEALAQGTTTDILQKVLHPHYKRPYAARLAPEVQQRLVFGRPVVSRALRSCHWTTCPLEQPLKIVFSNTSLRLSQGYTSVIPSRAPTRHGAPKVVVHPRHSLSFIMAPGWLRLTAVSTRGALCTSTTL